MDTKLIKELIALVDASDITEVEIEEGGCRIRIEKSKSAIDQIDHGAVQNATVHKKSVDITENSAGECEPLALRPLGDPVLSPMLGVFYAAPSPQNEPFVKVGDKVKKGDVLCIIDAMKLMNEIVAEKDGEIAEVCAENGQIVEFEQTIFRMV